MKFLYKHPALFYIWTLITFIGSCVASYFFKVYYVNWNETNVIVSLIAVGISFVLSVIALGLIKERKWWVILIESIIFAGGTVACMFICDILFKTTLSMGEESAGTICMWIYYIAITVLNLILLIKARQTLPKQALNTVAAFLTTLSLLSMLFYPVFNEVILPQVGSNYTFTSEPSVFISSNDTYRILFSTSAPGTGEVTITDAEGNTHTYYDQVNGVARFDSIFHRIDVPASVLDGSTYYVTSSKTKNGKNYGVSLGAKITGKEYTFHGYEGSGDVSFMCISDIQGTATQAQRATADAAAKYTYDFVLMLGDFSNGYNNETIDFVEPILKVAASASRSSIPCLYVIGNHENKGLMAKFVNELLTNPSPTGELYYTYTIGDAHFTALNFGDDHNDDMERYHGVNHFNEYKDKEYDWLVNEVIANHAYDSYRYNVVISHIPAINDNDVRMDEYICGECELKHDYKWTDFINAYEEMGVDYVVSGHTHSVPREVTDPTCSFTNLQTGSKYNSATAYRNSIVYLKDGTYSYIVYGE